MECEADSLCQLLISILPLWELCSFSGSLWQEVSCGHLGVYSSPRLCFPTLSHCHAWDLEETLLFTSGVLSGSEKRDSLAPTYPLAPVTPAASQQS